MKLKLLLKKICVFMFSMAVVLTAIPSYMFADESNPKVYLTNGNGFSNSSAYVELRAENFDDVAGMELSIFYDINIFSEVNVNLTDLGYSFINYDVNTNTPGEVKLSFMSVPGVSGSGTLAYMYFYIKDAVKPEKTPITLSVGDTYNSSLQPIVLQKQSGEIEILENQPSLEWAYFYSYISNDNIQKDESFVFSFCQSYPCNMACGDFSFIYDKDLLEVTDIKVTDALKNGTALYSVNQNVPGLVKITCSDIETIYSNGNLFDITFKSKADIDASTQISVTPSNLFDAELKGLTSNDYTQNINLTKIEVEPEYPKMYLDWDETYSKDGTVILTPVLEGISKIAAGDFTVYYDKASLECVEEPSVRKEVAEKGGIVITNEKYADGVIKFSFINSEGISSDQKLIDIKFKPIGNSCNKEITLSGVGVVDKVYKSVQLDYQTFKQTIHTISTFEAKKATCTENGNSEYRYCSLCKKYFSSAAGQVEIEKDSWIIPAKGHQLVKTEAIAPTKVLPGCKAYWTCSTCHKHFEDEECTKEITNLEAWKAEGGAGFVPFYIKGDVNNDGVIDAADVTALARHIANLSIITDKDILIYCCDTDGDGDVDAADVTHLARYIANLISEL